jgi:hypothetical protein
MCFTKHFQQFSVLNVNVNVCLKGVHELVLNLKKQELYVNWTCNQPK